MDGRSLRTHLESLYRQTGKRLPELDADHCPPDLWHVWDWFLDLYDACPNSIGYADIKAWAHLTGSEPSPEEVRLIRTADRIFLQAQK